MPPAILFFCCRLPLTVLALLVLSLPLSAAGPRDELLKLVPDDVGFCVVVQDLRGHWSGLLASPFVEQLLRTELGKGVAGSEEFKRLVKANKHLERQLGVGWSGLRDDILGDAVVFAYRPGPPGKPEREQGIFLVRARTAKGLASLVDRLNQVQKESGELKELSERQHKGVKYHRHEERKSVYYYCLLGPVLLLSSQEDMLQETIERSQGPAAADDAAPAIARYLQSLGLGRSLVAVWVNPRAFDAAVTGRKTSTGEKLATDAFSTCWKSLQGLGLGVELERELNFHLAVRARVADLPASARKFLAEAAKPSSLWQVFPDDALLAMGCRIDVAALFELLGEFMSKESRQELHADLERNLGAVLGKHFVKEVLPALGPDWGFCLTAPPPEAKTAVPRALYALRLGNGPDDLPTDQAIATAVNSVAILAVLAHNRQNPAMSVRMKAVKDDKVQIKFLEGEALLGPDLQPAFALKGGYLLLASSPDQIRRFIPPANPPAALAPNAAGKGGVVPLVRITFKRLRPYLEERRDALATLLAGREGIARELALKKLDAARAVLDLVDGLELRQQVGEGQVTFTLNVRTARPLRK